MRDNSGNVSFFTIIIGLILALILLSVKFYYITIPLLIIGFIIDKSVNAIKKSIIRSDERKRIHEQFMYNFKKEQKMLDFQEVDGMSGDQFEHFTAKYLLPSRGFTNCDVTPYSGDYGVDVVAYKNDIKYAVQCKRFNEKVTNKAVQEVYAGKKYYDAEGAIVITNGYFTPSALNLANKIGVELWDRDTIYEIIKEIQNKQS